MPHDGLDTAGLTRAEAARRLASDGANTLPVDGRADILRQLWTIVSEPMLLLVLTAGVVNFLLAEPLDGSILMSTMVMIIGLSLHQQRKTATALGALREVSAPWATVVRDGATVRVPGADVVRGDLIVLVEGDRVPADALIIESENIRADESTLTGESVAVSKVPAGSSPSVDSPPGGDGRPHLFSGTLIVKGHCRAVVTATGARTSLGRIGVSLGSIRTVRTPLQRETDRIVRVVAVIGGAAAVFVAGAFALLRGGVLEGILAGIATAMAVLPEEYPVILSVFLALGAWRLSHDRVLARRPEAIETLGSMTVLCVDKTGTLTMNEMTVAHLWTSGGTIDAATGAFGSCARTLIRSAALACPSHTFDPMDRALRTLDERVTTDEELPREGQLVREYPLSSELLAVGHAWKDPRSAELVVAVKGAPETVARLCGPGPDDLRQMSEALTDLSSRGERILGVARCRLPAGSALPDGLAGLRLEFLGLVGLHDPVRPGVPVAVQRCNDAGVRVIMITGDHPGTARAVAGEVGIRDGWEVVTGAEMDALSDEALATLVGDANVFARVTPDHKLRLVRALQSIGEIVGMTGDGVNDAPALRQADIGMAMGRRGTDVARDASALVITDDDFGSIVRGIERGRGIFENIRKAMSYVIAVHTPIVGMAVIPLCVPSWPLVLMPLQIALLELIIDPTCSVVFESESIDPGAMSRPPRRAGTTMFDRRVLVVTVGQGLVVLASVLVVYGLTVRWGDPAGVTRSTTFTTLVLSNLALMFVNRSWHASAWTIARERRNPSVPWVLAITSAVTAVLLLVPVCRRAFGFGMMDAGHLALSFCGAAAGVAWFEAYKCFRRAK